MATTVDRQVMPEEQQAAGRPTWPRRFALTGLLVILVAVGATAYLVFTDQPTPTTVVDEDLALRRLVNQGLIPKQALETIPPAESPERPPIGRQPEEVAKSEAQILQDLANRGLIPQQAVPRILSETERAILVDAINRGLVPKEVLDEG
jgi:hypothetical protein